VSEKGCSKLAPLSKEASFRKGRGKSHERAIHWQDWPWSCCGRKKLEAQKEMSGDWNVKRFIIGAHLTHSTTWSEINKLKNQVGHVALCLPVGSWGSAERAVLTSAD
jgi:hypothetical protein